MKQLMAKSSRDGQSGRTLLDHTVDVVKAFVALFGVPGTQTRLTDCWTTFFRLDSSDAFLRNTVAAAWFHDWGKANDGFQRALQSKGGQLVRHEHLSAMLMHVPSVRQWLRAQDDLDYEVILSAVATHHLKASLETIGQVVGESDSVLRVEWQHPAFRCLLEHGAKYLGLTLPVPSDVPSLWCFEPQPGDFDAAALLRRLKEQLSDLDDSLVDDEPRRRLLWAVRAGLIAADSAGSGLVREQLQIRDWIDAAFAKMQLLSGDDIRRSVIEHRIAELTDMKRWKSWTGFQEECAKLPERALLLAPCGSGKTLAAWRWIAARLDDSPAARVIFLYPTRGTATEGFRDYVAWAPETDAALVHGTSTYDLDGLFEDVDDDDPRSDKSFESCARLFALKQWSKRIFSATVDQFLGFLQYGYAPICHLPLLVDSVVVVDEVHSFDRGMFSALLDFLKTFDVPVLCMTATLPPERRNMIAASGVEVYPQVMPADLQRVASYERYRVRRTDGDDARQCVLRALWDRRRVLWVVNTVARAQTLARELALDTTVDLRAPSGAPLFCYHSRFKLEDRKRQHRSVIDAFKHGRDGRSREGVLAITTQVCEMSLDLDADMVVTEEAPITSLIQRMGRGCRESLPTNGRFAEVLIYRPGDEKPYTTEQMRGVAAFVDRISAPDRVSQADLDVALRDAGQPSEMRKSCRFLESGPWALGGEESFREGEGFTRQAVLPEDVKEFARLRGSGNDAWRADGLVLPVPIHLARDKDHQLPRYMSVAAGGHYMKTLGYLDEPRPISARIV